MLRALHMKMVLSILAVLIFFRDPTDAAAQIRTDASGLLERCGGYYGLCGYIDESDWRNERRETEVLPKIYEGLGAYSEGLAPVRVQGRWGFMDREGVMRIEPIYLSVSPFDFGLAVIGTEGGYGLINPEGDVLLAPDFKWLAIYAKDVVLGSQSDNITFDPFKMPPRYKGQYGYAFDNDDTVTAGVYNLKLGWLTDRNLKFRHFDNASKTYIWARSDSEGSAYGLINTSTGEWHVKPTYDSVRPVSGGKAIVGLHIEGAPRRWESQRYGAIDNDGHLAIPATFEHLNDFRHGFGETRRNGKIALVNHSGTLVAGKYFDDVGYAHHDRSQRMVKDGDTWWKVLPNGTLHPEESSLFLNCLSGLSFVGFMERTIITHPDGRVLGDDFQSPKEKLKNYFTDEPDRRCEKPISVKNASGKWGFISPQGDFLADGVAYENLLYFRDGGDGGIYAGFEVKGLWGIMTDEGEIFREPQFGSTSEVLKNIPDYKSDRPSLERGSEVKCSAGSRLFTSDGKWGLQDEAGRVLVKAEHDLLTCFTAGTALVPDYELKKWCHVDREGERRETIPCEALFYPSYRSHSTPEALDADPWLNSVKWTRQYYEYGLGLRDEKPKLVPW